MRSEEIIKELIALELLFEEGRKKAYSIRSNLERFYAPAPSGDDQPAGRSELIQNALKKRKSQFYKSKKKGG